MSNYTYDESGIRYELYQSNGNHTYNWLFFPGGPGADSRYLKSLIDLLDLPGDIWLIDLPGNGDNLNTISESYDYDEWYNIFMPMVKKFNNPVFVGHSFGGMFPLMFPELEKYLKGFVILNSAPSLWLKEAVAYSQQFSLPDLTSEMQAFIEKPNQQTFEIALDACMPYYFPKESLEKGRAFLKDVPCHYKPAVWWQRKVIEINFSATWIPQNLPVWIVGAKFDCICPYTLFEKDKRFNRPNITRLFVKNGGHLPWIESPKIIQQEFKQFVKRLKA